MPSLGYEMAYLHAIELREVVATFVIIISRLDEMDIDEQTSQHKYSVRWA